MNRKYISDIFGATIFPKEKIIAFYGGIFSQWAACSFTCEELLPNITLNCAEQGMMLMKAREFGDTMAFDRILKSDNPRVQKAIGRAVENFDPEQWDKVALGYVTTLNVSKFSQNFAWKECLKLVPDFTIVEASPVDKIWGVGMGETNPDICNPEKWDGQNLLGVAIMNARDQIIGDCSFA
jgi:ribA/ribD-fused uncharacterized protein